MARHNQWQDDKLLKTCLALGEDTRREDLGVFFGSIHRTLDQILVVDRALLEFALRLRLPGMFEPHVEAIADYSQLADELPTFDAGLLQRFELVDDAWLEDAASFYSD